MLLEGKRAIVAGGSRGIGRNEAGLSQQSHSAGLLWADQRTEVKAVAFLVSDMASCATAQRVDGGLFVNRQ